MDELTKEELKSCLDSLIEITICAICLSTVQTNMVQCVNGHVFCTGCIKELDTCPTCREAISRDKLPGILSQVVEVLPRQCTNKHCGKYMKINDDDHEKFCGFKLVSCKISNCQWEGPGHELFKHVQDLHPQEEILSENCIVIIYNFQPDKSDTVFKPMFAHGKFFWCKITNDIDKNILTHTFQFVPSGKPEQDLCVKVKSVTGNVMKFAFKMKLKLDPGVNDLINYFCVPNFMLLDFVQDGRLMYKLSVKTV